MKKNINEKNVTKFVFFDFSGKELDIQFWNIIKPIIILIMIVSLIALVTDIGRFLFTHTIDYDMNLNCRLGNISINSTSNNLTSNFNNFDCQVSAKGNIPVFMMLVGR